MPDKNQQAETSGRKAWTPKTPTEIVLEQIGKQEKRVSALQKDLDNQKRPSWQTSEGQGSA